MLGWTLLRERERELKSNGDFCGDRGGPSTAIPDCAVGKTICAGAPHALSNMYMFQAGTGHCLGRQLIALCAGHSPRGASAITRCPLCAGDHRRKAQGRAQRSTRLASTSRRPLGLIGRRFGAAINRPALTLSECPNFPFLPSLLWAPHSPGRGVSLHAACKH